MNSDIENEIDLIHVLRSLLKHKKKGCLIVLMSILTFVAISFVVQPTYQAQIIMAPVSTNSSSPAKQLGGLGSLIDLGGAGVADEDSIYMATLISRKLTREFINENNLLPVLYAEEWDTSNDGWKGTPPTLWKAVSLFDKKVRAITTNKETGIITLAINWSDAEIAAKWATAYVDKANIVLRDIHIQTSNKNREYLESQIKKTDNNELRNMLFSLIQEELKKEMLAFNNSEFAYKTIDPAIVPEIPLKPNKILYVLFGIIFGLLFYLVTALYLDKKRE